MFLKNNIVYTNKISMERQRRRRNVYTFSTAPLFFTFFVGRKKRYVFNYGVKQMQCSDEGF